MNNEKVEDFEVLFRAVKRINPGFFDEKGNPLPALFLKEVGISVDRDGGRKDDEVVEGFKRFFADRYRGTVKFKAEDCSKAGVYVEPDPSDGNPYHAQIYDSPNKGEITLLKAMYLTSKVIVIENLFRQ